jgi:sugar/nucleoside kinase (ribokinase family)
VKRLPETGTNVTAVMTDGAGAHTFVHRPGAARLIDRDFALGCMDLFARAKVALLGYYNLLPHLEPDLPKVLAAIRESGCRTALDTANGGGALQPLDAILPHLDFYIPSLAEARNQTGQSDPRAMIETYRACGTDALLGIKLGDKGALLSPEAGAFLDIPAIPPPGPVVDTTGAGDCFVAGLIAGLLKELPLPEAAGLGAATAAHSITGLGASMAVADYDTALRLSLRS